MALAVLASCGGTHRDIEKVAGRIPLPANVRSVRLAVGTGSFEVRTHTDPELRYEGLVRRAAGSEEDLQRLLSLRQTVTVEAAAETGLLLVHPPDLPAGFEARDAMVASELAIWLPADVAVDIEVSGSGRLAAGERRAPVRLATHRGELSLSHCEGPAQLRTGSGATLVDWHRGDLAVEAAMGDIQAFVREPGSSIKLVTGLGNVMCFLPPDAGFEADVRTDKGKVANAFGLPVERVQDFGAAMSGRHGNGRTRIVMRSGGGLLALNRKVYP
jgi:hypothetical protein